MSKKSKKTPAIKLPPPPVAGWQCDLCGEVVTTKERPLTPLKDAPLPIRPLNAYGGLGSSPPTSWVQKAAARERFNAYHEPMTASLDASTCASALSMLLRILRIST